MVGWKKSLDDWLTREPEEDVEELVAIQCSRLGCRCPAEFFKHGLAWCRVHAPRKSKLIRIVE